jgi:hypothetical protein
MNGNASKRNRPHLQKSRYKTSNIGGKFPTDSENFRRGQWDDDATRTVLHFKDMTALGQIPVETCKEKTQTFAVILTEKSASSEEVLNQVLQIVGARIENSGQSPITSERHFIRTTSNRDSQR